MAELTAVVLRLVPAVLLLVGALFAVQRWMRVGGDTGDALRVVARSGLTRSSVVAIVAVGGRRFLVGASESGVRLLTELGQTDATAPATSDDTTDGRRAVELIGGSDPAVMRPRTGLVDRLRDRTVRMPVNGTGHVVRR